MEKELNIAAILKDKPKGTKMYLITHGNCTLHHINDKVDNSICVERLYDNLFSEIQQSGKLSPQGEVIIFPSKEMRSWEKFAWKKGDVLKTDVEEPCYTIFSSFQGEYTEFSSRYYYCGGERWLDFGGISSTNHFIKASDEEAKEFIKKVEEHYCGKLNLSTLEIEQPKQEFKDGDIVINEEGNRIYLLEEWDSIMDRIFYHACLDPHSSIGLDCSSGSHHLEYHFIRLATDSEKQLLFSALKKRGKVWDAEKKMLVDLPKKCGFRTMDWCLMRDHREKWKLCQFGFFDKGDEYEASYNAVGGNWYNECIPYNYQTAHLLGTTDEWEGGK